MKINFYYGGRGSIGDPSLAVVKRMMKVCSELNIKTERYDLFAAETNITTLPQTLKDCDGIILATTVEWHGIGGYLTSFLDACWLYGDKDKISSIYMAPVVISTTYGEKEAALDLKTAWETLGGKICEGISAYVPDTDEFERNESYMELIGSRVEKIYKTVNKRLVEFPSSSKIMTQGVIKTKAPVFTQQETEQLSVYISDESYVSRQKQDIKDIAGFFKKKLTNDGSDPVAKVIEKLKSRFVAKAELHVKYKLQITDKNTSIAIRVENAELTIETGDLAYPDAELSAEFSVVETIAEGRKTFQGAFMEGKLVNKGDFAMMRMLDEIFPA